MKSRPMTPALCSTDKNKFVCGELDGCVQGSVGFDAVKGAVLKVPLGVLVDTSVPVNGGRAYGEPKRLDAVHALTRDGYHIVLRDVIAHTPGSFNPGFENQILNAESMIASRKPVPSNPRIRRINVDIPGLAEWLADNPIRHVDEYGEKGMESFSYSYCRDPENDITLYKTDSTTVRIQQKVCDGYWEADEGSFTIRYMCILEILFNEDQPTLDQAVKEWVEPLWSFFCFCMGTRPSINELGFQCLADDSWGNLYQRYLGKERIDKQECLRMPFKYKSFGNDTTSVISRWLSLDGDVKRASRVLINLLDEWKMPLNLNFIACASSFEALTRAGAALEEFDEEELNRRLELINSTIKERRTRKWAQRHLRYRNRKDANALAKGLMEKLDSYGQFVTPDTERLLSDHRGWRNNYIHQNDLTVNQQDMQALYIHTHAIWLLGFGAIALELGFNPDDLVDMLKKTRFMSEHIVRANDFYSLPIAEDAVGGANAIN